MNYINKTTGELINKKSFVSALRYFKADGKRFHYSVRLRDIHRQTESLNKTLQATANMI